MRKSRNCSKERVWKNFSQIDLFGQELGFNLDGEERIKSVPGIIISILLLLVLFAYGISKFRGLLTYNNPNITTTVLQQYYDSTYVLNFKDHDVKVAFAVESYDDQRIGKDDPNYVQWVVQLTRIIGKVETDFPLKFHKCTEQDYESFFPPSSSAAS